MSNFLEILKMLEIRCYGKNGICSRAARGTHEECKGKVARRAAIYSTQMCEAILLGFKKQLLADKRMRPGKVGTLAVEHEAQDYVNMCQAQNGSESGSPPLTEDDRRRVTIDEHAPRHARQSKPMSGNALTMSKEGVYTDDITGQPLRPDLCKAARRKELDYFESKEVWTVRPIAECVRITKRPPISTRWVEVNKGDDDLPNVRSRLVAREIKMRGQ